MKMNDLTVLSHPYSAEYYEGELNFAMEQFPNTLSVGKAVIKHNFIPLYCPIDGYMYATEFNQSTHIPTLMINGDIWMSITPMEIESHFIPLKLASGKVGVGGLGLGYYVRRLLTLEDVTEIHVYETNLDVIELYIKQFGEDDRVTIHAQDVLTIENQFFDFFYMDIYYHIGDPQGFIDKNILEEKNTIKRYHFWGVETFIAPLIVNEIADNPFDLKQLIKDDLIRQYYIDFACALTDNSSYYFPYDEEDIVEKLKETNQI